MANSTQCAQCGSDVHHEPSVILKPFCDAICMKQYTAFHPYEMGGRPRNTAALIVETPRKTPPTSAIRRAVRDGDNEATIQAIRACCDIQDNGCWQWQGSQQAYPTISIGDMSLPVHRISLEARIGKRLGKQAAHHICANTICVNPDHLQPVTAAENTAEMLARTYMVQRITELERELQRIDPSNALLAEVSISST